MNAERLFTLYDRVAEAPHAVSRLRRFVLDLAVRGMLVEQDPYGFRNISESVRSPCAEFCINETANTSRPPTATVRVFEFSDTREFFAPAKRGVSRQRNSNRTLTPGAKVRGCFHRRQAVALLVA